MHTESRILDANEIVKSPGIPEKAPLIKEAYERRIPVISEIEFAGRYSKAKFICISGTNGKTTTTLLTYHLLKSAGLNVGLAGNIGESLAEKVIEDTFDYYVLELSSFQLDGMYSFKANIAVLLEHHTRPSGSLQLQHGKLRAFQAPTHAKPDFEKITLFTTRKTR